MIEITSVTFDGRLAHDEEPLFRGAIVKALGGLASPLFHNHLGGDGLRFAYPMVQYKIVGGRPTVVGVGMGRELAALRGRMELTIGREARVFCVADVKTVPYVPAVGGGPMMYALRRYLPLNADNAARFDALPALTDRVCLLERTITANILSFFKGVGFRCADAIDVAISSIDSESRLRYKGVSFRGFDLTFIANVRLPDAIGLGKSPSVGFGVLSRCALPERFAKSLASSL